MLLGAVAEGAHVTVVVNRGGKQHILVLERIYRQRFTSPMLEGPEAINSKPLSHEELLSQVGPLPDMQTLLKKHTPQKVTAVSAPSLLSSTLESKLAAASSDDLRDVLQSFVAMEDSFKQAESTRAAAELERQQTFEILKNAMVKQAEGIDKLLKQSLLRERELSTIVAQTQRSEDMRRSSVFRLFLLNVPVTQWLARCGRGPGATGEGSMRGREGAT